MYLLSQTAEQYTMLPLLSGWMANKKSPCMAKQRQQRIISTARFYCVTQYHNSMVRKGSVLYDFFT